MRYPFECKAKLEREATAIRWRDNPFSAGAAMLN
jgi:hypothetical protein